MSETRFTSGPWVADTTDPSDVVVWAVPDPSDKLIANIGQRVQQVQVVFDCDIANAHLIAASPDMYAALDLQTRNCPQCKGTGRSVDAFTWLMSAGKPGKPEPTDCHWCRNGRAALAKARGEA